MNSETKPMSFESSFLSFLQQPSSDTDTKPPETGKIICEKENTSEDYSRPLKTENLSCEKEDTDETNFRPVTNDNILDESDVKPEYGALTKVETEDHFNGSTVACQDDNNKSAVTDLAKAKRTRQHKKYAADVTQRIKRECHCRARLSAEFKDFYDEEDSEEEYKPSLVNSTTFM